MTTCLFLYIERYSFFHLFSYKWDHVTQNDCLTLYTTYSLQRGKSQPDEPAYRNKVSIFFKGSFFHLCEIIGRKLCVQGAVLFFLHQRTKKKAPAIMVSLIFLLPTQCLQMNRHRERMGRRMRNGLNALHFITPLQEILHAWLQHIHSASTQSHKSDEQILCIPLSY